MRAATSFSIVVSFFLASVAFGAGPQNGSSQSDDLIAAKALPILIRDVLIPAREPGVVQSLAVKEGDRVSVGELIASLDHELYALERESAEAKLAIAQLKASDDIDLRYSEKSKQVADATLVRSENASIQYPKAISRTEIDKLRLEGERASLSIEKAIFDKQVVLREAQLNTFELQAATTKFQYRSILSPVDGFIVEIMPQEGEWISAGAPIARIIQLDRLRITALLEYDRIDKSFVGRSARFQPIGAAESYQGQILFVSPEVYPDTNLVQFYFDVENPDLKLRPGEPGQVTITVDSQDQSTR